MSWPSDEDYEGEYIGQYEDNKHEIPQPPASAIAVYTPWRLGEQAEVWKAEFQEGTRDLYRDNNWLHFATNLVLLFLGALIARRLWRLLTV